MKIISFKAVPSKRMSFYLGSPLHIIRYLFSHFCLFQNAVLHKMLKLSFSKFKLIFLRMQFCWLQHLQPMLVATFFATNVATICNHLLQPMLLQPFATICCNHLQPFVATNVGCNIYNQCWLQHFLSSFGYQFQLLFSSYN